MTLQRPLRDAMLAAQSNDAPGMGPLTRQARDYFALLSHRKPLNGADRQEDLMANDDTMLSGDDWVAAALAAGVDPQHVWKRRELEGQLIEKCATAQAAIERATVAMCALIAKEGDEDELVALMCDGPNPLDVMKEWHKLNVAALRLISNPTPMTQAAN